MYRRQFLKGLIATPIAASLPAIEVDDYTYKLFRVENLFVSNEHLIRSNLWSKAIAEALREEGFPVSYRALLNGEKDAEESTN